MTKKNEWVNANNANEWMKRAETFFNCAKAAPDIKGTRYEVLTYICGMSVEYSLKALMILKLKKFTTGHRLEDLINNLENEGVLIPNCIKDAVLQEYFYDIPIYECDNTPMYLEDSSIRMYEEFSSTFSENIVKTRYPGLLNKMISKEAYQKTLIKAEKVVTWVNQQF